MEQPIIIENLDQVKKRVSYSGFGNRFDQPIDENFANGLKEFKLSASEVIENKKIDFELDINSKENKGFYNGFKATLTNENGEQVSQWFKASDRITINEAYLMMEDQKNPRAVHKTLYDEQGEKYGTWLQLDFTKKTESGNHEMNRFHDKYGFDLLAKFDDYAFLGLETPAQKLAAYNIMAQGRQLEVTPVNQEKHATVILRANPKKRTIHIMDTQGNFVSHDQFRTEEAKARIQQEKNARDTSVSFVNKNVVPTNSSKEQLPGTPPAEKPSAGTPDNEVKKKTDHNGATSLKKRAKPRMVDTPKTSRGKAL